MAKFKLSWFNSPVLSNANASGQKALYRQKSVGGAWTEFATPPKFESTVQTPELADNKIWEFKVQCLCTEGGPTDNDNGIQEAIHFACIEPTIVPDTVTVSATFNLAGLDITKGTFYVRDMSDVTVFGPIDVTKSGTAIGFEVSNLEPSTQYTLISQFFATVNGKEVASSLCSSGTFMTAADVCDPIVSVDAFASQV